MKKQIITVASVALAVILLFVGYTVFLKDNGIQTEGDPFYTLTEDAKNGLSQLKADVEIDLKGYNSADDGWVMIQRYASVVAESNKRIDLTQSSGDAGVTVTVDGKSETIAYDDFFKTLYDGTRYAFDGESLIVNAILDLSGVETLSIPLRALDGFDTDGDTVTNTGVPFVFPSIQRNEIAYLSINNSHGSYSIYQEQSKFYFSSSRAVSYDEEKFAMLTTNCRYLVSAGKMDMPEGQDWAAYGLDSAENAEISYSIMTTEVDGIYDLHTVYVGKLSSSGSYYFGRYIGGRFEAVGDDKDEDKLIQNFSKDKIYFIPVSTVVGSLALPETDVLSPSIMTPIADTQTLFKLDNIRIDYYDEGISALAKNMSVFNAAKNLSAVDTSSLTKVISDKKSADENYSKYANDWREHLDVFGAFTSSDGKATAIDAALARSSSEGKYKVRFGLLRDEKNGAYMPNRFSIYHSVDRINWIELEDGEIIPSQSDGSIQTYELEFETDAAVKYLRIEFDVPQKANSYVVIDEIRIYADGEDAQPSEAISGTWKLVAPKEYLANGMNYAYLDMTNFNDFVQYIASLEGEKVVACGFSEDGDASPTLLDKELLAKYGLESPSKHYSFEYAGLVCDVYVSARNEEGKYYAYATYSGEANGKSVVATSDVIVELSEATCDWLGWDFVEFLDHSLFSIYLVDISDITVTFDDTEYKFLISKNDEGALGSVSYNGKSFDTESFKYVYQAMIGIYMQDEYVPEEGDKPEEYLRLKINTETNSPEIVFYRVSSTKCYFTINGEGSYYALVEEVNAVRDKVLAYIAGETITR